MFRIEIMLHARQARPAWRVLLLVLVAGVCWLAFTPNPTLPSIGGNDKLDHLVAFASLGLVAMLSLGAGLRQYAGVAVGLLGFGIFIELVQIGIPGRSADWHDVVADMAGMLAGIAAVSLLRRLWPLPTTPPN